LTGGARRAARCVPKVKKKVNPRTLPIGVLVGIMPRIVCGRAVAILYAVTTAPTAGRVFAGATPRPTLSSLKALGLWLGLLRLIGPSRWPHVLGEGFLARDASVSVVVVVHH